LIGCDAIGNVGGIPPTQGTTTMDKQMLKDTNGNKVKLNIGDGRMPTFTAGGKRRFIIEESKYTSFRWGKYGYVAVNCKIRFADGTLHNGIALIDEESSGELCGMLVFMKDVGVCRVVELNHKDEDIFPIKYKLNVPIHCNDIHVGDDGWSR
tara:strand:+ start:292 stop:747 length:456 start_codon:yes stop_codon:yes gene_type:complete